VTDTISTGWIGLRLDPLDTLFFRDGRPFDAANRVVGGLPNPQTLAGALRTALLARTGFRFDDFAKRRKTRVNIEDALRACGADDRIINARLRGPFLALADDAGNVEPLLPMPAVLAPAKGTGAWVRAWPRKPEEVPGWDDPDLWPLVRDGQADAKADSRLITLTGLTQFLDRKELDDTQTVPHGPLYDFDDRVGIVIDGHSLTTVEGQLYAIRLLSLQPQKRPDGRHVCLYAELQPGTEGNAAYRELLHESPVPFGGEGKYVRVRAVKPADWPQSTNRPRSLWYLATPTFLPFQGDDKIRPRRPLPRLEHLKAAASGAGVAVSGWDVAANGPRPTRFAVPAGAVYFVDGPCDESAFLNHDDSNELRNLRREGWGFALQGKWE
jgi:CRISPR-associated protein Cmr3